MRDIVLFGVFFGILPFIFKRPAIGVLAFTWISLMNPHRLTYGAAFEFPFAAIATGATCIGLLMSKDEKRFPITPVTVTLLLMMLWMTMTTFPALEQDLAWKEWGRVSKTMFMVLLAMTAIRTEKDIKLFAWVVGLSLAFYGVKGGLFTIKSGGSNHVFGPEGSYIEDNNALALALLTAAPIVWYLRMHADNKWIRRGLTSVAALMVISVVGSYSRGALLGGATILLFLWIKSEHKAGTAFAVIIAIAIVPLIMPEQWFDRMSTINKYQADASALGRLNAWQFAVNVAESNFMGGGFVVFTPRMFMVYAPEPLNHHAAHSIYFQVLGEHGFIGIALFLLLMFTSWRTGSRIIKRCKNQAELKWAHDLASMCQVCIIGFAVGGAFLTLAYYDLYYDIITILVVLEKYLLLSPSSRLVKKPSSTEAYPQAGN